jgi:hypothetical protein
MKALMMFALSLFVSASALAGGNPYTRVESVIFAGSSMFVPANKTCISNGYIFHKTKTALPVRVCEGNSDSDSNCKWVAKAIVPQPVKGTFVRYENCQEDSNGNARNCKAVAYTLDQSKKSIISYRNDNDSTGTVIGTYVIPACKTAAKVPAN